MTVTVGFQMDPFDQLSTQTDSTLRLAFEAQQRGYPTFAFQPNRVTTASEGCTARGVWFTMKDPATVQVGASESVRLSALTFIWMRQDPPFDMAYVASTFALEGLSPTTTILNDPRAVRNAPEKWLLPRWQHRMPPTCISADVEALCAFHQSHGQVVCKPIFGHAGHDVVAFEIHDHEGFRNHVTQATLSHVPVMVQKFLPDVVLHGDTRVLLMDGYILGAFRRVPRAGDFRANMRLGAEPQPTTLSAAAHELCTDVAVELASQGLMFAGIDLIQDYLIEINVTSPTGLATLDALGGGASASRVWDAALAYRARTLYRHS